jgi:hypothetical protein
MATAAPASCLTEADIRRRLLIRQMLVFGGITLATCTANVFTALSNYAREDIRLAWWEPTLWEYSSGAMILALIPAIAWLYRRAPITARTWRWAVPLHVAVTPVFSLIHVGGMVLLRKLGYVLMHAHYNFGAWWPDWFYEYRKDLVAYALILGGLQAFRTYRLWLETQMVAPTVSTEAQPATSEQPASESPPLERLVVKKLNREFILNASDIDRIDANGNYVTIYAQGSEWPLRESMTTLERRLDPARFARVHRGHIVNLDRIREIQPWDSGDYRIVLTDGSFVNFSRRYRSRLPQLFN